MSSVVESRVDGVAAPGQLLRTVARNSAFGLASQALIKVISFGFSVIVVRSLGAEVFGQYSAVLAFGSVFVFLADLGLSPYTVREISRMRDRNGGSERIDSLFANVLVLRLLLSVLTSGVVIVAAILTQRPLVMIGAIALGTVGLIMFGVQGTAESALSGFERLDISAKARVLSPAVFVALGAVALLANLGYYGLIVANLFGTAAMTLACWRGVRSIGVCLGDLDPAVWPSLLRSALPFGVIGFALGLSYRFDSVLLNVTRSDTETGYYVAAYNLVFAVIVISNVINTALYPSLTRRSISDPSSLPRLYGRSLRYLMAIALPIAVGTSLLANELTVALYKDAYLPSALALRVIIWAVPLMFLSEFLGYVIVIDGRESKVARALLVSTGVNVLANLLLVPRFGYLAASALTVATEGVLVGQYFWVLRSQIGRLDWDRAVLRPCVACGLMAVAIALTHGLPVAVEVALAGVVYLAMLAVTGAFGREELHLLRGLAAARK